MFAIIAGFWKNGWRQLIFRSCETNTETDSSRRATRHETGFLVAMIAKALGIEFPPMLLGGTEEVIE